MFLHFCGKLKQCLKGVKSPGWQATLSLTDSCPILTKASFLVWAGLRLLSAPEELEVRESSAFFAQVLQKNRQPGLGLGEVSQCLFPWVSTGRVLVSFCAALAFRCPSGFTDTSTSRLVHTTTQLRSF